VALVARRLPGGQPSDQGTSIALGRVERLLQRTDIRMVVGLHSS
jgi:hypothetical protein